MAGWDRFDGEVEAGSNGLPAPDAAAMKRAREEAAQVTREIDKLAGTLGSGLRNALEGVAVDGMKLSDAMKGIARSMADTAFNIAMKPIEQALTGAIAGGMQGMLGGIKPFAEGGAFLSGRVTAFAKGGVVSQPTYFPMRGVTGLMGEAGAEAIMPLQRGADGRLGVAASGGGARPVNVTVNVTTPDVAGFRRSQSQIAAQLGRALTRGERNG